MKKKKKTKLSEQIKSMPKKEIDKLMDEILNKIKIIEQEEKEGKFIPPTLPKEKIDE